MKIYTKTGDAGKTSLIGGTKVPKHHIRVEAYGAVDELNVYVGLVADQDIDKKTQEFLRTIQQILFVIGSHLAADPQRSKMQLPELPAESITALEQAIDTIDALVPPMRYFILPGGDQVISFCHVARVVCRRAERAVSHLQEREMVEPDILIYLNRLSDYLFMVSRKVAFDRGVTEIPWKPDTEKK